MHTFAALIISSSTYVHSTYVRMYTNNVRSYFVHTWYIFSLYIYSEIVVDPSYEELEISDSTAHIISNRVSQLNNIKVEGKDKRHINLFYVHIIAY